MSLTAKSVVFLAKSCRPVAEPVEVNTTFQLYLLDTSATHWLIALAVQLEPEPVIDAWLEAAETGAVAVSAASEETATAARTAVTVRTVARRMNSPWWAW